MKVMTNKTVKNDSWGLMVRKDFRLNKSLYAIFLPVLAFYLCFNYLPMFGSLIAFKNYKPQLGVWGSEWAGFKHFVTFFNTPSFWSILGNTFRISFANLIFGFPAPIILALLLNELKNAKFAKFIQNATYLPYFVSLVVVCGLVRNFTLDTGVVTKFLTLFGFEAKSYLNYPEYFTTIHVASGLWQATGWDSIVYLAALSSVDTELYEAADIDGANGWQKMMNVTLPSIVPTIVTMLILRMGGLLNVGYEKILLLSNNATLDVADVISSYVYRKGLVDLQYSFSSAVDLFNALVNLVFLLTTNVISKKVSETSLW